MVDVLLEHNHQFYYVCYYWIVEYPLALQYHTLMVVNLNIRYVIFAKQTQYFNSLYQLNLAVKLCIVMMPLWIVRL